MDEDKLKSIVESLLFISGEPVKISRLAKIIGVTEAEAENGIMKIKAEYVSEERGVIIMKKEDQVQMVTNPDNSSFVDQFVKGELQESLSKASLEVLSVIAYRSPVTRADIEAVRGVNSSFILRNLLLRGLIERVGNPDDSRSYLYKISFDFLKKLGIDSVEKLPDYEELSKNEKIDSIVGEEKVKNNN